MPTTRVVVVDDNSFMRRVICEVFERQPGIQVIGEAGDGREAIEKITQLRPNLVVIDQMMPLMSGIEAAQIVKRMSPDVHVILFTAYADPEVEESALRVPIDAVVSKDEGTDRLVLVARRLLGI